MIGLLLTLDYASLRHGHDSRPSALGREDRSRAAVSGPAARIAA